MKTSLKRLLTGMVAVAMMMSMSVMAFAEDDTTDGDDTTVAATEDAGDEDDATDAATDDTADATTTAAATSNPSTGAADSMVALTAMGAFLVLAGGAAAVTSKSKA